MVSLAVVELSARFTMSEGSQTARGIGEKRSVGDVMCFGEAMEERRPQKSEISDELHVSTALINVGGSLWASASVCVQFQIAP